MLQPPAPAREPTAWMHVPSQPLMRSPLSQFQTPAAPRKSQSVFSGLVAHPVTPLSGSPSLLRIGNVLFSPTLSAIDGCHPKQLPHGCQCPFSVQTLKFK